MSRIIGVLNYKGGTGKTTTVVNLAAGLALRGARVLGIDLDPQGSLATHLGVPYDLSLSSLLLSVASPERYIVRARQRLDLIPSDSTLLEAEGRLWNLNSKDLAYRFFTDRLQGVSENYDYVILDFSPSPNLLSESALHYTNEVIVPVAMNYLALVGTRQVIETLKSIGQMHDHNVNVYLILPTFFNSRLRIDNEVMEILQRYFPGQVAKPIRMSAGLAEAPGHKMTIYEYAPKSVGALDYARLVERVCADG